MYYKLTAGVEACCWSLALGFTIWTLIDISFFSGEPGDTSAPLYHAAWLGMWALVIGASKAWLKLRASLTQEPKP